MTRIFLCHASEDKAHVREVYRRLQAIKGFEPWLDEEDLLPGQDWAWEIPRALQASDFILIFLSRTSVAKRGYVQREMKQALDVWQELPEGVIHTIPVRLDDCDVPEPFWRYHYANLFDPNGFDRIVRAIRAEVAKKTKPPEKPATKNTALETSFTNSIGMEFVLIPAGSFLRGSPYLDAEALDNEKPTHRVTISRPFYLGKYPVTQAQWEVVMGDNPSDFKGDPIRPVAYVSWNDVQAFIQKLNEREGGRDYRLPTEAQWEYACCAGTETPRYHADIDAIAWYRNNSNLQTHPVGQKLPNAWGLYDMLGNVWEWCLDWYDDESYYQHSPTHDPQGPAEGSNRVLRGGSWFNNGRHVRAARRNADYDPSDRSDHFGFRLARGQASSK
jgi:formylglycine-generating enzyme required for sulfatase activity